MSQMTLQDLSKKMADIDFAMLTTRSAAGDFAARPMSNNGDVEYDGDSFYFCDGHAHTVADIERDSKVGLTFEGGKGLLGKPRLFVSVEGTAELIRDKSQFAAHWTSELDRWFGQGVDTPGLTMIKVHATRIHYWDGEDQGEIAV